MVQPFDSLFLLSDVPGDVAYAVAGVAGAVVVALWRQHLKDQSELKENIRQITNAQHAQADSNAAVARALEAMGRPHDSERPA